MKSSDYNFIINRNQKTYWYNGVTHSFFTLSEALGKKIEIAMNNPDIIETASKTLYNKLFEGGFIIADDINEIEHIQNLNEKAVNDNTVRLTILPTLNCNYKCWYCIQDHVAGTKMSTEVRGKVKRLIENKAKDTNIENISIEWFGGEPFMYFDVIEDICKFANKIEKETGVKVINTATTNGYFLTKDKIPFLNKYNFVRFQITLDGVKESHDKVKFQKGLNSAFDRVLTNINTMLAEMPQLNLLLRINYTRENLSTKIVNEVCKFIKSEFRNRVTIMPRKVWQVATDESYQNTTKDIWERFQTAGFKIQNTSIIHDFVPCYTCRQNFIAINHNGHLLKCTANDDLYRDTPLGIISDDGLLIWDEEYERKFQKRSFDNEKCLKCKYLPICMGVCPKNYQPEEHHCKKNVMDLTFEDSIVNEIENAISNS